METSLELVLDDGNSQNTRLEDDTDFLFIVHYHSFVVVQLRDCILAQIGSYTSDIQIPEDQLGHAGRVVVLIYVIHYNTLQIQDFDNFST